MDKSKRHETEEMESVESFVILTVASFLHFPLLPLSASLKILFLADMLCLEVNN